MQTAPIPHERDICGSRWVSLCTPDTARQEHRKRAKSVYRASVNTSRSEVSSGGVAAGGGAITVHGIAALVAVLEVVSTKVKKKKTNKNARSLLG